MNSGSEPQQISSKNINRLKIVGVVLTLGGIGLFAYFVYAVGLHDIHDGVVRFGLAGFAVILFIYFLRICARAYAWKLSVCEDHGLRFRDTIPAVIIGEALSSMIPLGILISGTAKAVAVRKRVPLVVGLSSVATENLFFSLITGIFLVLGAITFVSGFDLDEGWIVTIDMFIATISFLIVLGILMVVRQWHFASGAVEWLYRMGIARRFLEHLRLDVRLFENLIYGFYRRYPKRFVPVCLLEAAYHILGVMEVWFILTRISEAAPGFLSSFMLETVSRLIIVVFKLVPFVIGVDEAGAQVVAETLALGAGVGVTLAVIRKGRVLFWTAIGLILIVKRGLSIREISQLRNK